MLKEIVECHRQEDVSIYVIWLPMVPGDDEGAARSTGTMYAGHRVHQYYDGERLVGFTCRRELFATCLRDALSVMPKDNPLYAELSEWAFSSRGEGPLWDAVLFYSPGVEWKKEVPPPVAWSKQVGFYGSDTGDVTGMFFRNDCTQPPSESDWHVEVRNAMSAVGRQRQGSSPQTMRIELLSFPNCPNAPTIRKNLESALRSLNCGASFDDVNLETLPQTDPRRGWGSPTILMDGRDLMGMAPPANKALTCRAYSDDVPSAEEIAHRLSLATR